MDEYDEQNREMRQMEVGSVMVWGMILPTGKVFVFKLNGRINSNIYIDFLSQHVKPILDREFMGQNYYFHQDNASIHVSKHSMNWLKVNFPNLLDWPAETLDLNPVENVWKMLSDRVYDGPSYENKENL